ncbi:MAG: hypothetical protein Q4A05_08735 [Ruminococcus sp.]|nr:hypothetical protein [Ruminococcus sp.]
MDSEAKKVSNETIICPKCTTMISLSEAYQPHSLNSRRSIDQVADIMKFIAYITWGAGILLAAILLFFYDYSIWYSVAIVYSSFVSGMIFFALGEIARFLIEIRNNQE